MSAGWLVAIILGIGALAYFFSAQRARAQRDQGDRSKEVPHSLPLYHGWFAFLLSTLPALIVFLILSAVSNGLLESRIGAEVGTHVPDPAAASLQIGIVHNAANALNKLGLSGADADAYAKTVVMSDFEEAGDHDVFRKIRKDLDDKKIAVPDLEIRQAMNDLMATAVAQIEAGK